jgi:hypothetical protein
MKNCVVFALNAGVGVFTLLATVPAAHAQSIGIKFAADQPSAPSSIPPSGVIWPAPGSMLDPKDITPSYANGGANPQGNWNNVTTNSGVQLNLVEDGSPLGTGIAVQTTASVSWYASGTWASTGKGEENNNFAGTASVNYPGEGADAVLMAGYLDMSLDSAGPQTTIVQIDNLPPEISGGFGVYIYALGGQAGRGGVYQAVSNAFSGSPSKPNQQLCVASGTVDSGKSTTYDQGDYDGPDFIQVIGDDNSFGAVNGNTDDFGNFMYFPSLQGTSVTITATSILMPSLPGYSSTPRAPINAVQIVAGQ